MYVLAVNEIQIIPRLRFCTVRKFFDIISIIIRTHDFPTLGLSHIHTYFTHLNKQSSDSSTKAQNLCQVSTS